MANSFTIMPYKGRFVCFDRIQSGHLYYQHKRINLVSGETEDIGVDALFVELENYRLEQIDTRSEHLVYHFFYESGFYFNGMEKLVRPNEPLAVVLIYGRRQDHFKLAFSSQEPTPIVLEQAPSYREYEKGFAQGYQALKKGDCYQFNYTHAFNFHLKKKTKDPYAVLAQLWKNPHDRGAYAHGTYLGSLEILLISNSPECLFNLEQVGENYKIVAKPIKGTIRRHKKGHDRKALETLKHSVKDRGELNMITDLIRNDLSRIESPGAKIEQKQAFLAVPGLYHQYSKISHILGKKTSLHQILKAVFPGGSITGAPKKRVIEILRQIEPDSRGFYCGSTLIASGRLVAASINIRSGYYWPRTGKLRLFAGGGITLKSRPKAEFEEMYAKLESVLGLLGASESACIKNKALS